MVAALCPRCTTVVALHEGRPSITATGVELWHLVCWSNRDIPLVAAAIEVHEPIAILMPGRRISKRVVAVGFGAFALFAVIASHAFARDVPEPAQVDGDTPVTEPTLFRATSTTHEIVPPKPAAMERLEKANPIPVVGGKPVDEVYPALRSWIHPITQAPELIPSDPARHFGAHRSGIERVECGEGHCGMDLDGPFGRPLVAVAAGVILHVDRSERGADGMSGRYVRIQHEDGTLTSYMHMDEIEDGLDVGNKVLAGQYIGTLGSSAVEAAHLHFALELPGPNGDTSFGATRFVDPAPFLVRSLIVESAQRRHSIKPAF